MKIIQDVKFQPVTIIIETKEELGYLKELSEVEIKECISDKALIFIRTLSKKLDELN